MGSYVPGVRAKGGGDGMKIKIERVKRETHWISADGDYCAEDCTKHNICGMCTLFDKKLKWDNHKPFRCKECLDAAKKLVEDSE